MSREGLGQEAWIIRERGKAEAEFLQRELCPVLFMNTNVPVLAAVTKALIGLEGCVRDNRLPLELVPGGMWTEAAGSTVAKVLLDGGAPAMSHAGASVGGI